MQGTTTSTWPSTPTPARTAAGRAPSAALSPSTTPGSTNGRRAADIFVRNLKSIYPLPEKVYARSTTALGEVRQPRMPAVLLELGYHDNYADARWVQNNIQSIAANLVLSLTEYFACPSSRPLPRGAAQSAPSRGT